MAQLIQLVDRRPGRGDIARAEHDLDERGQHLGALHPIVLDLRHDPADGRLHRGPGLGQAQQGQAGLHGVAGLARLAVGLLGPRELARSRSSSPCW